MRRLLCALLSLLSLLGGAAGAEEGRLWLHGDFESVETDGYRLQNGFYEYEKIAHKGDISLYAVGYEAESGYALLTPEEAGGDLTYERMEDADLGAAQAGRWRYTDAGSRWDFLAVEAEGFFFSIMIAVPETGAERLDEEVEALIASLSLRAEPTDDTPMLGADTSGFTLVMDTLADDGGGLGRVAAWAAADGGVSVTFQRGAAGEYPFDSAEHLRETFAGEDAERLEDVYISGRSAERWRFTLILADGSECPAEAVLLPGEEFSYAAVFGLTGGETPENAAMLERLLDSLALS